MAVKEIKTRISLDGEAKFKSSLRSVNSQLKVLASEVKAVSASFDKNKATIKDYQNLNTALNKLIEQQKIKTSALATAVEDSAKSYAEAKERAKKMAEEYGENSEQAKKASKAVEEAENKLQRYTTQLNRSQTELNRLNLQFQQNEEAIKKLEDTTEDLTTENEQLDDSMKKSEKSGKSFKDTMQSLAKVSLKAMETSIKATATALKGISTASIKALTTEVNISMKAFAGYQTAIAGTATALTKASVSVGASFEKSMSNVQALKGLDKSSVEFQKLEEKAKEMGKATSKTATESADALGYMALAGWDVNTMLTSLEPILRASEAGNLDLAMTSDLVTDTMSTLGYEAKDLNKYLDTVIATQNNSNTSMQQMLEAYIGVGGMFKTLNVDMAEGAAIIGILANRGKKGAEAGNNLNSILINLVGANSKAKNAMEELGVSAWDQEGNFIGLEKTLKLLSGALSNATQEQRTLFEAAIGGKTQFDTLQMLIDGVENEYDKLYQTVSNCDGALMNTAKTMQDNVKGSFVILQSALEGFGNEYFASIAGNLKDLLDELSRYVSLFTTAFESDGFSGVAGFFNRFKTTLTNDILGVIPSVSSAYTEFSNAFNKITLDLFDVGLATATPAISSIIPVAIESFTSLVDGIAQRLPTLIPILAISAEMLFEGVIVGTNSALSTFAKQLPTIIKAILPTFTKAVNAILPNMIETGLTIIEALLSSLQTITEYPALADSITSLVERIALDIYNLTPTLMSSGGAILTAVMSGIITNLPTLLTAGLAIIMQLVQGIYTNIVPITNATITILDTIIQSIVDNSEMLLTAGIGIIIGLVDGIVQDLPRLLEQAVGLVMFIAEAIANNIEPLIDVALDLILALVDGIIINLDLILDTAPKIIEAILIGVLNNLDDILNTAGLLIVKLAEGIVSAVPMALEAVAEVIKSIIAAFAKADWWPIGENIVMGIIEGIPDAINNSVEAIKSAAYELVNVFKTGLEINSPSKVMKEEVGVWLLPGVVEGMEDTEGQLDKAVEDTVKGIDFNRAIDGVASIDTETMYSVMFSSNIDEIQRQLQEMSSANATMSFFANASAEEIENARISSNTTTQNEMSVINAIDMIYQKLNDIENDIRNIKTEIHTTNYLYPNAQALSDTVVQAVALNSARTGGW